MNKNSLFAYGKQNKMINWSRCSPGHIRGTQPVPLSLVLYTCNGNLIPC